MMYRMAVTLYIAKSALLAAAALCLVVMAAALITA